MKKILIVIIVIIIAAIIVIPKLDFSSEKTKASQSSQMRSAIPVKVKVMKNEVLDEKIIATGTIMGKESLDLRSEISGKITKINFKEGSKIKKGELLVKINDADLQAQLEKAEFRKKLAEDKVFRQKALLDKALSSQQEYDVLLNDLNTIIADISYLKAQIDKTEILAPFDGMVGLRNVSAGSYITPSIPIATFQSIDSVKIDFNIPQKYFSELKVGKIINFRISSSAKTFTGRVYAVEPKIDPVTRTLKARAISSNSNRDLVPGSFTEIVIMLSEKKNALMIPTESLVPDISGEKVFLYKNGQAFPQAVKSGIRTERDVQIISGLTQGDTVITSGIIQLRPGIQVAISDN